MPFPFPTRTATCPAEQTLVHAAAKVRFPPIVTGVASDPLRTLVLSPVKVSFESKLDDTSLIDVGYGRQAWIKIQIAGFAALSVAVVPRLS